MWTDEAKAKEKNEKRREGVRGRCRSKSREGGLDRGPSQRQNLEPDIWFGMPGVSGRAETRTKDEMTQRGKRMMFVKLRFDEAKWLSGEKMSDETGEGNGDGWIGTM